jgi:hypothetical protein
MRGSDSSSGSLFSSVDVEERIPATHPLRTIRSIVNEELASLDAEFAALYEDTGRQSIAPERLGEISGVERVFLADTPKERVFTKTDLARCLNAWAASGALR